MNKVVSIVASATVMIFCMSVWAYGSSPLTGKVTCMEKPLEGVKVTDGKNITLTGPDGRYLLQSDKEYGMVYITPPSGYVPESRDGVNLDFYAFLNRDADGPEVHDFKLREQCQDSYSILFVADIHLTGADFKPDLEVFRRKAMPAFRKTAGKAAREGAVYSINLGDLSHERYWYRFSYNLEDAYNTLLGSRFPTVMYSTPGNHDNDCAVLSDDTDFDAGHLYRRTLGPEYYSVDIGDAHWLFMDDTIYENSPAIRKKAWPDGAAGSISYSKGFTAQEMEWLEKDLSYVSPESKIFLCTHCPLLSGNSTGTTFPVEQMERLSELFSRFGKVTVFSGHMHKMQFSDSEKWPLFHNISVAAFSGDMWESSPNRLLGVEGEDGGTLVGKFRADGESYSWHSHLYGEKKLRCYDMNSVARHYASSPELRAQMEEFPQRDNYANKEFRNMVFVNYWMYRKGERVEILENGRSLDTRKVNREDPLFNISYYLPSWLDGNTLAPAQKKVGNGHMFAARTLSPDSDVVIRIIGKDGKPAYEEKMKRPKAFGPKTR